MNIKNHAPIVFGSVLTSLFTLLALSVNVSAQDAPDFLLGDLANEKNLTNEQRQEISDRISNYWSTMKEEANGNGTKFSTLVIEDMAKRKIIDEDAKQGFLSFIGKLPKSNVIPDPGNLTIPGPVPLPGNNTGILKDLDTSSAMLDEIANNNSDSQTVILMTDVFKKQVSGIKDVISGNVTDTGIVPFEDLSSVTPGEFGGAALCAGLTFLGGTPLTNAANFYNCLQTLEELR